MMKSDDEQIVQATNPPQARQPMSLDKIKIKCGAEWGAHGEGGEHTKNERGEFLPER